MSEHNCHKYQTITHIIFDLDGTLIDSELWGFNNANKILAKFGKQFSLELYSKLIGLDSLDRCQHIIDLFKLQAYDKQTFRKEWVNECMKSLTDIQLMPGVETFLEYLKKHDIPLAIATAGAKIEFSAKTNHLSNVFEEGKYFQHIIHGDNQYIQRPKPFPDIYQFCISQFDPIPDPKSVLVFEDNSIGLSAAVSAGVTTVLVNDKRFFDVKDSEADIIINGFSEFKPQMFGLPHL